MTKGKFASISWVFIFVWTSVLVYVFYRNGYSFWLQLISLWFLGTLVSSVRKIPLGCVGDVEIVGSHVAIWGSGYALVPPLFPFFLLINRYLIGVSTRPEGTAIGSKTRVVNEENFHHRDDRFAQRKVRMETGPLGMLSISVFQNFFRVLFNMNHPSHFAVLSLPFMAAFYVLLGVSVVSSKINALAKEEAADEVVLLVGLKAMPVPLFPERSKFVKKGEEAKLLYFEVEGQRYFYHPAAPSDGSVVHVRTYPNECYLVMAGETIVFEAKTPPVFVANMEVLASYIPKGPYLPLYWRMLSPPEEWKIRNLPSFLLKERRGWRYVHSNWNEVDTRYNLVAAALPENEISKKAGGGLVCF